MKKLKVGLIGCGNISIMHLAAIEHDKNAVLTALCDIDESKAYEKSVKYNVRYYTDYKKMICEAGLDAVHICTPHFLHAEMTLFALKKGLHVLSEKPMSIAVKDAVDCVETAERLGLQYGVVFQCRYNTPSVFVKRVLDSGELGRVLAARSVLTWSRPDSYYSQSDWKGTWDKEGGGVIIDQAIHSIDLVNWFIGEPAESVQASINNRAHQSIEVEDSAEGLITYRGGVKYGFYAMNNYSCDEPIEIKLHCEKGKVILSYEKATVYYDNGKKKTVSQRSNSLSAAGGKDYWGFQHGTQISCFYKSVLGQRPLKISGREAHNTQRLIEAIYRAGKSGQTIYLCDNLEEI